MPASIFRSLGKREVLQTQSNAQNVINVSTEDEFIAALTALPNADSYCYGKSINIVSDIIATQQVTLGLQHSGLTIGTVSGARISTSSTLSSWLNLALSDSVTIRGLTFTANFAATSVFITTARNCTIAENTVSSSATITNFALVTTLSGPIFVVNNKVTSPVSAFLGGFSLLGGFGTVQFSLISGNIGFAGIINLQSASYSTFTNNLNFGFLILASTVRAIVSNNDFQGIDIDGNSSAVVISGNGLNGFGTISTFASVNGQNTIYGNTEYDVIFSNSLDAVGLNTPYVPIGAARVKIQSVEETGTTGQVWIRDTGSADGGAYGGAIPRRFSQVTATFTGAEDSVTITVSDTSVLATSNIIPTIAMGTRDLDEMEMAPVVVAVGTITPSVGFTIIAVSLDGDAVGDYLINYVRD